MDRYETVGTAPELWGQTLRNRCKTSLSRGLSPTTLLRRNNGSWYANTASFPPKCHGSAERAGGAAARGGGGDGGRRGRRQARCRRSGDGRYSDRAGRRQTAPHADAAPRRNPPEPEMRRSEAEGSRERSEAPEGAARRRVRRPESSGERGAWWDASRDTRNGGMAFGAHEPPRTRRRPRPCRANPH